MHQRERDGDSLRTDTVTRLACADPASNARRSRHHTNFSLQLPATTSSWVGIIASTLTPLSVEPFDESSWTISGPDVRNQLRRPTVERPNRWRVMSISATSPRR